MGKRIPPADGGLLAAQAAGPDDVPLSIKIGVTSGCYHAEHSPEAYAIIDAYLVATGHQ